MRKTIVPAILCAVMLLSACGGEEKKEVSVFEPQESAVETQQEIAEVQTEQETAEDQTDQEIAENQNDQQDGQTVEQQSEEPVDQPAEQPAEQDETVDDETDVLTEDQAYNAVINYCKATIPGFDGEINDEGYTEYWNVSTNENGEIVVLYRSYTAAQTIYYVDPASGETYVTEFVPGITDEEQKTGETFNARDYLQE